MALWAKREKRWNWPPEVVLYFIFCWYNHFIIPSTFIFVLFLQLTWFIIFHTVYLHIQSLVDFYNIPFFVSNINSFIFSTVFFINYLEYSYNIPQIFYCYSFYNFLTYILANFLSFPLFLSCSFLPQCINITVFITVADACFSCGAQFTLF